MYFFNTLFRKRRIFYEKGIYSDKIGGFCLLRSSFTPQLCCYTDIA